MTLPSRSDRIGHSSSPSAHRVHAIHALSGALPRAHLTPRKLQNGVLLSDPLLCWRPYAMQRDTAKASAAYRDSRKTPARAALLWRSFPCWDDTLPPATRIPTTDFRFPTDYSVARADRSSLVTNGVAEYIKKEGKNAFSTRRTM